MKPSELEIRYFSAIGEGTKEGFEAIGIPYTAAVGLNQMADALESVMKAEDDYRRCYFNDYSEKAIPHQEWLARIEELRNGK